MSDFFLQIISGVQVGKKIKVGNGVTLGRHPENTVCFTGSDGTLVSGRHAAIEPRGEEIFLKDVGSTNGTYVNGEQVEGERSLRQDEVISLGVSGPKLRVLSTAAGATDTTSFRPTPRATQFPGDTREARNARTEFEGKKACKGPGPGGKPSGDRSRFDALFGGDPNDANAGNYTMGLAQRLKNDEADSSEFQDLIKDKKRAERIVNSGMLSRRDAQMISSAATTYSSHRKQALIVISVISVIAVVIVSVLAWQNMGYRGKLKQQEELVGNVKSLENKLTEEVQAGHTEPDQEKAILVAKLRAAERQLMSVRSNLKSTDVIQTYKNPLGREIHTILEGFGKRDYIVPDIFISQVEKHINSFSKGTWRPIIDRSFRNKPRFHRLIEDELTRQGMPLAFFYLAMHESLLDSTIISSAGARGLWQFMPQTAREYGLNVPVNWRDLESWEDERTVPAKATRAGVKYVKTLYAEFGDVALAMAAYNAGEGRIRKALRSIDDPINNRDFWYIYRLGTLAAETNEYVPKIIATMIIDKNRARYGFPAY